MSRQRSRLTHSHRHQEGEDDHRRLIVKEDSRQRRRRRRKKLVNRRQESEPVNMSQAPLPQDIVQLFSLSPLWRFPLDCNGTSTLSHRRRRQYQRVWGTLSLTLLLLLTSSHWSVGRAQTYVVSSSSSPAPSGHYIEYNLADYCSEENWSDYPGRHQIRLEKSLIIRRPSIVDFHYNDTHRQHLGGGSGRGRYGPRYSLIDSHPSGPNFVPYCLLSFTADFGHRIFAEGFATGLQKGGKDWFTETLHFQTTSESDSSSGGAGNFIIATQKESLSMVFEQLHLRQFSFHLVLTPFRDAQLDYISPFDGGGSGACDPVREYRCRNDRCIANYLTCDHQNNCQDYSDEDTNCLAKVPTPDPNAPPPSPPSSQRPPPYPPVVPDYEPSQPTQPRVPTFDVNGNRIEPIFTRPVDASEPELPEYVDVPLPTDYPPYHPLTTRRPNYDTINGYGVHSTGGSGGFLEDLFTFSTDREVSNVVYAIRYLAGVITIIAMITIVNLCLWCFATKNDGSMMAPAASPVSTLRPQQPATSQLSVVSDV